MRWEAVTGAVRYELVAWTSGAADWQEIGGDNLTGTTYSHTGLAAGTTYYYMVRAVDAGGVTGPWSEYVSATVAAAQSTPVADTADREVLVALYNGTDGANWANNSNWLSERPLGDWHGVTTDGNGRVTGLSLYGHGLSGPIPPELGNLSKLRTLSLFGNQLSGTIPAELGNLSKLELLYLTDNQLSGCIPDSLFTVEFNDLYNLLPSWAPSRRTGRYWLRSTMHGRRQLGEQQQLAERLVARRLAWRYYGRERSRDGAAPRGKPVERDDSTSAI